MRLPLKIGDRTFHFGVLICYEDSDAVLARRLVEPGPQPTADFIVNISNDGWFMGTSEHAEHLAVSRFRAIETRRALLRSVNGGISAVVDGNGRIVALPGPTWAASQSVTGVVSAAVPLDTAHESLCSSRRLVAVVVLGSRVGRFLVAAQNRREFVS